MVFRFISLSDSLTLVNRDLNLLDSLLSSKKGQVITQPEIKIAIYSQNWFKSLLDFVEIMSTISRPHRDLPMFEVQQRQQGSENNRPKPMSSEAAGAFDTK